MSILTPRSTRPRRTLITPVPLRQVWTCSTGHHLIISYFILSLITKSKTIFNSMVTHVFLHWKFKFSLVIISYVLYSYSEPRLAGPWFTGPSSFSQQPNTSLIQAVCVNQCKLMLDLPDPQLTMPFLLPHAENPVNRRSIVSYSGSVHYIIMKLLLQFK